MEVLLNELSLTGQFKDEDDFFNNFDSVLKIIKLLDILNFSLAKEYMFFDVDITPKYKLSDFLRLRTDKAKRMKRFLAKLAQNPPFWNETQRHNSYDKYFYNSVSVSNTSLAESCERDRIIISFTHNQFLNTHLIVQKNSFNISIINLTQRDIFLEYLLENSKIKPLEYCNFKYKNSNLNFSNLEEGHGFDLLETSQQINEFLTSIESFSKMSWLEIVNSDGLQYKRYKGKEFRSKTIYKFRVTQKYRCFGYREKDEFFILRFEIDHKTSDNG